MRTLLLAACIVLAGCLDNSKPDVVVDYERLGETGYIYTAKHRGHLYAGTVTHAGCSMIHSPECECRGRAESAEQAQ